MSLYPFSQHEPLPPVLVLGDYIQPSCDSNDESSSVEECLSGIHLKWPLRPKLRPNSPLLLCQPRLPEGWPLNYISYQDLGEAEMVRTAGGLVDLDVSKS